MSRRNPSPSSFPHSGEGHLDFSFQTPCPRVSSQLKGSALQCLLLAPCFLCRPMVAPRSPAQGLAGAAFSWTCSWALQGQKPAACQWQRQEGRSVDPGAGTAAAGAMGGLRGGRALCPAPSSTHLKTAGFRFSRLLTE